MSLKKIEKPTLVRQEIHYKCPSATEVRLLWGINNWKIVPEEDRPSGTSFRRGVMQTPMKNIGGYFSLTVLVPADAILDFGFLITRLERGADVRIWDANGTDSLHQMVRGGSLIEIVSTTDTRQSSKAPHEGWKALPQLLVAVTCGAIAFRVGFQIIKRKRMAWQRRALLPTFKKTARPSRCLEIGTIGLSLMVGIASAEAILRVISSDDGLGAARDLSFIRNGRDTVENAMRADPVFGLRPRLNYGPYSDYGTRTNDYNLMKAPGTMRLLILGGKVVFQGQLVDAFKDLSSEEMEIWNGGVETFGTVQTINFYSQYQSKIKPDKIILVITPSDLETTPITYLDKQQNLVGLLPYLPSSTINHFLLANSLLYRLGIGIQTILTNHEDKILEEARIELKKFSQSVTKQKTDLLIVVLPLLYPEDVWSTPEKQRYAAILQMLKQADLKHIDLLPAFHQALNEQLPLHHQTANPFQPSKPLAQRFAASIYDYDHLPSARETALIRLPRRTQ